MLQLSAHCTEFTQQDAWSADALCHARSSASRSDTQDYTSSGKPSQRWPTQTRASAGTRFTSACNSRQNSSASSCKALPLQHMPSPHSVTSHTHPLPAAPLAQPHTIDIITITRPSMAQAYLLYNSAPRARRLATSLSAQGGWHHPCHTQRVKPGRWQLALVPK